MLEIILLLLFFIFIFLCSTVWQKPIENWHDKQLTRSSKRWYAKNKERLNLPDLPKTKND